MEYQVKLSFIKAIALICIATIYHCSFQITYSLAQENNRNAQEETPQNDFDQPDRPVNPLRNDLFGDQLILPLIPLQTELRNQPDNQENQPLNNDRAFNENLFDNVRRQEREQRRRTNLEINNTELRNIENVDERRIRRRQLRSENRELNTRNFEPVDPQGPERSQRDEFDQNISENQQDEDQDLDNEDSGEAEQDDDRFEEEFLQAEAELEQAEQDEEAETAGQQNEQNLANVDRLQQRGLELRARRALNQLQNNEQNVAGARRTATDVGDQNLADSNDITGAINNNPIVDTYAPEGMPFGSFRLFPELVITALYSDNPTSSENNGPGDEALIITPGFTLQSDWSRHELVLQGQLTKGYFDELTSENIEEWFVAFNARLDIYGNNFISFESRFDVTQDSRGDADNLNSDVQLANTETFLIAGVYNQEWNRVTFRVRGELIDNDFEDVVDGLGNVINNDDQDFLQYNLITTLGYTFHPGLYAYLQGRVTKNDYETSLDDLGFDRNSEGQTVESGLIIDLTSKLRLSAELGYGWNYAADPTFVDSEALIYNFLLNYRPNSLTQINLAATRELTDTDINGTTSVIENSYSLALAHYFRAHLLLETNIEYETEEFQGIALEQNTFSIETNLTYILNRTARFILGYEFTEIRTNDGGESEENIISLSLNLRR